MLFLFPSLSTFLKNWLIGQGFSLHLVKHLTKCNRNVFRESQRFRPEKNSIERVVQIPYYIYIF